MTRRVLRWRSGALAACAAAWLGLLAACAVAERDPREDLRDAMKADMRACGTDTECLRKRQAARSRAVPADAGASAPGR
jgi:hypothetical protein